MRVSEALREQVRPHMRRGGSVRERERLSYLRLQALELPAEACVVCLHVLVSI